MARVYSSEHGRMCPNCRQPINNCRCQKQTNNNNTPNDGIIRVGRETKGRKGSGVTTVTGLPLNDKDLKKIAKELKKKCGSGGTIKDGVIEIQGEHRDRIVTLLEGKGYTVKRVGG
ncbi:MAG TPA: translation initiation factor Sui1 [Anaerolineae bacterium]|nr:translation initiation factor Sui1 [Anaerolineae bacterium]